jgi:membrane protease YdiL (CAAX protease family)
VDGFLHALWHVFVAWLVLVEPFIGVRIYRNLERRVATDLRARERVYVQFLIWEWAWMVVVAVLLLKTPEPFSSLGFRLPGGELGSAWLGFVVAVALALAAPVVLMRLVPEYRRRNLKGLEKVSALMPVTNRERWLWAALAVTAGICEEVVFRGFLTLYLSHNLPGLHPVAIAAIAGVLFGLGHAYQGWKAALGLCAVGIGLGVIYWQAESLVPVIAIHALMDLRILLVWKGPEKSAEASS